MEEEQLYQVGSELLAFREEVNRIKQEIRKIIVGQDHMIELMIAALLSDGHILIEGVPGVAKTLAAKLLSRTLDTRYSRIQFTPDLMPSDVLGTSVFNVQKAEFEFRRGPIFSQVVLIDEINRAPAKTQSALFEVMEERQITMDGMTYPMTPPFMVIATQNPIEQEGTYRLPEAQLDRFLFKIEVGYPDVDQETMILSEFHHRKGINDLDVIEPVLSAAQIQSYQEVVRSVEVEEHLFAYIVQIVNGTRKSKDIYLGASPRASINIMTTAKAIAAMRGRKFVKPEDIQEMAIPVLAHRIILTPEKEMEGATTAEVVKRLVDQIEVPR
ncbi:MAG: MoxR family ATPase [Bacteroidota bacterium]